MPPTDMFFKDQSSQPVLFNFFSRPPVLAVGVLCGWAVCRCCCVWPVQVQWRASNHDTCLL